MTTMGDRYALALGAGGWSLPDHSETTFTWRYDEAHERMLSLYAKGKQKQWDAATRIDWSIEVDPMRGSMPDESVGLYGSPVWNAMDERARGELRHHLGAWVNSQFLHGEQGALICSAKLVQAVPGIDQKFYGATQVMDEARHVEIYDRYLREKIGLRYPINHNLKTLLDQVITDSRWDFTFLGMQIMIEGLALAAFALQRDFSLEPLSRELNAYVMADEARHVAFGRLALRELYPNLSDAERKEREEFVAEASRLLYDRFTAEEVYEALGLPADECREYTRQSQSMRTFQGFLFSRIVPTIRDIGLWGPTVERCFEQLGVLHHRDTDYEDLARADEDIAKTFSDRRAAELEAARVRDIDATIALGSEA
jgi:hypothetical protein